jgi:hypothetical protein
MALLIPQRLETSQVIISDMRVRFQSGSDEIIALNGLAVKGHPIPGESVPVWSFALSKGHLALPQRPGWALNSGRITFSEGSLEVENSEWRGQDAGILDISGVLLRGYRLNVDMQLSGSGIPLKSIVPRKWKEFVQGDVNGEADWIASGELIRLEGKATGDGVTLVGIPALRAMQQATGISQWTELPLQTAFTEFFYRDQQLRLENVVLESESLSRLEGQLSAGPDKKLEGQFQVGLAPQVASKIPGAVTAVFTLEQNGYRWASPPMRVSGTTDAPREDLSPRLKGAVFEALEETVKEKLEQGTGLLEGLLQQIQ